KAENVDAEGGRDVVAERHPQAPLIAAEGPAPNHPGPRFRALESAVTSRGILARDGRCPLPHVANHVIQAVAIGREGPGRRAALPPVLPPHPGTIGPIRRVLVSPRIDPVGVSPPGRVLPLCLHGEAASDELTEFPGVTPRDEHDGMVGPAPAW